jgi:hypothetical protein
LARPKSNKLYRTFTKGLITEAGFLTYPENASTDELNTVIKVKGSRSRRFGLDWEPESIEDDIDSSVSQADVCTTYTWRNVANKSDVNFLCVQAAGTLYFYDLDNLPITEARFSFTVDLTDYTAPTATDDQVKTTPIQMASGKGYLFVVSPYIEPLILECDPDAGTIDVIKLIILIRDFDGVDDEMGTQTQPATLSNEHYYNLRNQGWVQPGPNGVVDGTPTAPYTGTPPAGSDSGTGGGGSYYNPRTGEHESLN